MSGFRGGIWNPKCVHGVRARTGIHRAKTLIERGIVNNTNPKKEERGGSQRPLIRRREVAGSYESN